MNVLTENKSYSIAKFPFLAAFKAVGDFMGIFPEFIPLNSEQEDLVNFIHKNKDKLELLKNDLSGIASRDVEVVNAFLKEHGFNIELQPDGGGIAMAGIQRTLVKWLYEGEKITYKNYPYVLMKKGYKIYENVPILNNPLIEILTQSKDRLFLTEIPASLDQNDSMKLIKMVMKGMNSYCSDYDYESLSFPMIDYDEKINIDWVLNLRLIFGGDDYFISQAKQQTVFKMNHKGAEAKSAVVMMMRKCVCLLKKSYQVENEFLLWIQREGVEDPIFVGFFDKNYWGEPNIDFEGENQK